MTRVLVLVFLVAESIDLALYVQAPHFEGGPMGALPPSVVVVAKVVAVLVVVGLARALSRSGAALVLAVGIAIAAFGAGTAAATLSIVNAAETPRSAPEPAPIASEATGIEQGQLEPVAPARIPAPRLVRHEAPDIPVVRGRASWYSAAGAVAAAGPALRRAFGRDWRGQIVRVVAGDRSVLVRLTDWCQCYSGRRSERVIDLSPSAFARLAPLSAGLIRVTVRGVELVPPATDR